MRRRDLLFAGSLGLFALLQLLPVGHPRTNPPIGVELAWDSAETRRLFFRACGDCHSNETQWPWYSRVAPVSWFLAEHVNHGRGTLNVSDWGARTERYAEDARKSGETVRDGSMPPENYLRMHPEARLSPQEAATLAEGLDRTIAAALGDVPD